MTFMVGLWFGSSLGMLVGLVMHGAFSAAEGHIGLNKETRRPRIR